MKPVTDRETLVPLIAGVIVIYMLYSAGQSWEGIIQAFSPRPTTAPEAPYIIGSCLPDKTAFSSPSVTNNIELPVTEGTQVPYSDIAITSTTIPSVTLLARWGAGEDGKYTWGQGETSFNDIALDTDLGIVAIGTEEGVEIRTIPDGAIRCNSSNNGNVLHVAMRSDLLLVSNRPENGYENVHLWNLTKSELLSTLSTTPNAIVEFEPQGERIITVNFQGQSTFWDVETHQKYNGSAMLYDASITDFAFYTTPQRGVERIAVVQSDRVRIRRPNGNAFHVLETRMSHSMVDFAPDGETIVGAGAGGVLLWNSENGEKLWENDVLIGVVNDIVFSPNGEWIAVASSDNILRIWNAHDGGLVAELSGHGGEINAIEISPDATFILSVSQDGTVAVWGIRSHP